jgi:hypothetical protein
VNNTRNQDSHAEQPKAGRGSKKRTVNRSRSEKSRRQQGWPEPLTHRPFADLATRILKETK